MAEKVKAFALTAALLGLPFTIASAKDEVFDPPSIDFFLGHEEIGVTDSIEGVISAGKRLFAAKFNVLDGAGRPFATGDSKPTPRLEPGPQFQRISGPDANSCLGCHSLPVAGGGGDISSNVFFGAHFADPIVTSIDGKFSNERHSPSLFGSGAVEVAASEISEELRRLRLQALLQAKQEKRIVERSLSAKGISFGSMQAHPDGYADYRNLEGIDNDLVVKPFGVKGIAISIREFSIAALNHHHGIQAIERYGWDRTGREDFDGDGVKEEFTPGQLSALVLFQASLPAPRVGTYNNGGARLFDQIGCSSCHVPAIDVAAAVFVEPNKLNRPGTLTPNYTKNVVKMSLAADKDSNGRIAFYSDFRRHNMCDSTQSMLCNEELIQDNVPKNLFMTARLWDLATSAPYCHRGNCPTVTDAIRAHGGEGSASVREFEKLSSAQKRELIRFLLSLGSADNP